LVAPHNRQATPSRRRNLLELRAVKIAQQQRTLTLCPDRTPILLIYARVHMSIGDEDVEQPVVVEIQKASAPA
jgi:hypothetical protein